MNASTFASFTRKTLLVSALTLAMSLTAISTSKAGTPSNSKPDRAASETSHNMKINIKIAGRTLTATLADNPTARDFASLLPLKVSMNDLFGRERYGHFTESDFGKRPQDAWLSGWRYRLLVTGSPVSRLLPPG